MVHADLSLNVQIHKATAQGRLSPLNPVEFSLFLPPCPARNQRSRLALLSFPKREAKPKSEGLPTGILRSTGTRVRSQCLEQGLLVPHTPALVPVSPSEPAAASSRGCSLAATVRDTGQDGSALTVALLAGTDAAVNG